MARGPLDRRKFLAGAAGLAAGSVAAACSGGDGGSTTTRSADNGDSGGAAAKPPAYVPFTKVKPDIAAGEHGIPAGYFHYPANPPTFIEHPMGSGGDISFLLQADTTMTSLDKNKWWQGINDAVKANLKVNTVPSADYTAKLQVTVAGGDLPDVVQLVTLANMPEVLERQFTDLTDLLSGDAIKEYPGLASIPPDTWPLSTLNGRIWGVAQPRPAAGQIASTRGDTLKKFGVGTNSPRVGSGQEFIDLCKELTDVKRSKFAIGEQPNTWVLNAVLEMVGAPNGWKEEDGKFTSVNETEEMTTALEHVTEIWKAGYIHPDSFTTPGQNYTWWSGGTTAIYFQSIAGWSTYAVPNPSWDIGVITLPKWDGGGMADKILGVAGYGAYAAIKKTDPDRVKEILRIMDFFAAPFGTKEYLTFNWGAEGVDYTLDGPDPVATGTAKGDHPQGLFYCGSQQYVNVYVPGDNGLVKAEHDYLSAVLPTGVPNPTWGLYSETASTKGATANKNLADVQADIIQGRKSLSDWDGAVKEWVKAAGDAERKEYEQAFAAQQGGR